MHPTDQKKWLKEKYTLFKVHHDAKTLGQFFPRLHEEYFAQWPPTPTAEDIEAVDGDTAIATARVWKAEEIVRGFELTK